MITVKTVKILLLLVLSDTITNNTIPAFAAKSSKSNSNVDKFSISSSNGNNIWKSHNENNNTHRYFTNILDKSIVDSVNTSDDGLFDTKHNEGKKIPEAPRILRRGKRYLDFVKGTRVSWRTTVKNNILKVNTLWGYGFGFRSNFPFADKADRLRPFFKRDLLHATVDMLDGHGLDGRACLLKSYCTAKLDGDSPIGGGMIFKLLKMLLRNVQSVSVTMQNSRITFLKTVKVFALILIVLIDGAQIVKSISENHQNSTLKRGRRYLDILPTTRVFYRVNCKNNIISRPTIWANGYGFRANFPINIEPKARPFKRDTYELMRELMDKTGFDGEACLLKAFCIAHIFDEDNDSQISRHGMLFKLLKYIFTLDHEDKRHFPFLNLDNCQQILHSHCPLRFNSISPYTDDV